MTRREAVAAPADESHDLQRLAELIERNTGNVIPRGQFPHLAEVAREHARAAGFARLDRYLDTLEKSGTEREWRRLLPDITIKESFLFRIPEQFRALADEILPRLARERPASHCFRVWSAGCARGEEPSTLAVVMAQCPALAERRWEIVATDVDEEALAAARRGLFGLRAMAHVPAHLLHAWFEKRGDGFVLARELRQRIELRSFNFFRTPYLSLGPEFDVVFLRNVLIYFSPDSQRRVVARVVSRLAPDGYLFLGHSETLWNLSGEMEPVELDGCFAYRRRPPGRSRSAEPEERREPPVAPPEPAAPRPAAPPGPTRPLADAAQALADDRFAEARAIVDAHLAASRQSVETHALSGLLHDLAGCAEAAVAAYRAALFLEPELFQIRLLLAHRLEHIGWTARARSEYRRTLTDLGNGRCRPLVLAGREKLLASLLPPRDEAARRCRQALSRV